MSFASRHNKGSLFSVDTEGFEFSSLKELYEADGDGRIYTVDGLYINTKSEYGDHPVAIISEIQKLVDFPNHMSKEVKDILQNDADIEDIQNGNAKFVIELYYAKKYKNKKCYGVRWV